jgi:hypothetical protein
MITMGDYVKKYYGRAKMVHIGDVLLYFSYNTLIAVGRDNVITHIWDDRNTLNTARHKARLPEHTAVKVCGSELERVAWCLLAVEAQAEVQYREYRDKQKKGKG